VQVIATLFDIAGLAMAGWVLMIVLPGWRVTRALVQWTAFPVALSFLYLIGVVAVLRQTGLGIVADFATAGGVVRLLAMPDVALIAWIHILAFDHLTGVLIFRDNLRHKVMPLPAQSLILFLTLMFGPLGLLAYWTARVVRGRGTDLGGDGVPAAARAS
jgi:hypothetical protein